MPTLPDRTAESRSEMVCPECWEEGLEEHDAFASRYDNPRRTLTHATRCPHDDCEADRISPEALDEQVALNAGGSSGGLGATISSVTPDIGDMSRKSAAVVIVVGVTLVLYGILPVLIGPVFSSGSAAPAEDTSPSTTEPSADSTTTSGIESPGEYYVSLQPDGAVITNGDRYLRSDGSPSSDPVYYGSMDSARSTYSEFLSNHDVSTDGIESTSNDGSSDGSSTTTDDSSDTDEESSNNNGDTAATTDVTGVLRGTVFDQDTSPISRATVRIEGEGISDETNGDGQYFLSGIPVGEHTVVAETAESTTTVPVEITDAGEAVVNSDPDNTLYTTETGSNVLSNSQLNIIESSTGTVVASGSGSTLTAPLSLSNNANADDVTVRLEPERTNGTAARTVSTADSGAIDRASTSVELPSDISTTQSLALASVIANERVNVSGTARGSETLSLPGNRQPTNMTLTISGTTGSERENVTASVAPNTTTTSLPVAVDGDLPTNVTVAIEPTTNTTARSATGSLAAGVDERTVQLAGNDAPGQLTATVRGVENLTAHNQSATGDATMPVVYGGNQPAVGANGSGQPTLTVEGAGAAASTMVKNGSISGEQTIQLNTTGQISSTPTITLNGSIQTGNTTTVSTTSQDVSIPYSGNRPAVGPNGTQQPVVEIAGNTTQGPSQGIMGTFENGTNSTVSLRGNRITGPIDGSPRVLVQGVETVGSQQSNTGTATDGDDVLVTPDGNLRPVGPANGSPRLSVTGNRIVGDNMTAFGVSNKSVTIKGNKQPLGVTGSSPSVSFIGQQETTDRGLSEDGISSGESFTIDGTNNDDIALLTLTGEQSTQSDAESQTVSSGDSVPVDVGGTEQPANATIDLSFTGNHEAKSKSTGTGEFTIGGSKQTTATISPSFSNTLSSDSATFTEEKSYNNIDDIFTFTTSNDIDVVDFTDVPLDDHFGNPGVIEVEIKFNGEKQGTITGDKRKLTNLDWSAAETTVKAEVIEGKMGSDYSYWSIRVANKGDKKDAVEVDAFGDEYTFTPGDDPVTVDVSPGTHNFDYYTVGNGGSAGASLDWTEYHAPEDVTVTVNGEDKAYTSKLTGSHKESIQLTQGTNGIDISYSGASDAVSADIQWDNVYETESPSVSIDGQEVASTSSLFQDQQASYTVPVLGQEQTVTVNTEGGSTVGMDIEWTSEQQTNGGGITIGNTTKTFDESLGSGERKTVSLPELTAGDKQVDVWTDNGVDPNWEINYRPVTVSEDIEADVNADGMPDISHTGELRDGETITTPVNLSSETRQANWSIGSGQVEYNLSYTPRWTTEDVRLDVDSDSRDEVTVNGKLMPGNTTTRSIPLTAGNQTITSQIDHSSAGYTVTYRPLNSANNISVRNSSGAVVAQYPGLLPANQTTRLSANITKPETFTLSADGSQPANAKVTYQPRTATEGVKIDVGDDGQIEATDDDPLTPSRIDLPEIDTETDEISVMTAEGAVTYDLTLSSGTATHNITVTDETGSTVAQRDRPLPSGETMTVDVPITSNRTFHVTADGNSNYTSTLAYQARNATESVEIETTGDDAPEVDTDAISPGSATSYTVPVNGSNATITAGGPAAYEFNYSATSAPEDVALTAGNATRTLTEPITDDRTVTLTNVSPGTDDLHVEAAHGGLDLAATWTERNRTVDPTVTHAATGNVLCSVEGTLAGEQSCYIPDGTFTTMTPTLNVNTTVGSVAYELSMNGRAVATDATVSVNGRTVSYPETFSGTGELPTTFGSAPTQSISAASGGSNTVGVSTQPVDGIDTAATARLGYEGATQWTKAPVVNVTNTVGETRSRSLPYSALEDGQLKSPHTITLPQEWFSDGTNTVTVNARDGTEVTVTLEATGIQEQETSFD